VVINAVKHWWNKMWIWETSSNYYSRCSPCI